jgi:hypothetical protein
VAIQSGDVEAWAPWGAGVLVALPVLLFRYPPMGDIAFHESLVAILRHFGDRRWFPEGLYERNLGQPNQLFHGAAWLLSLAMPTDVACKLVVAATLLGAAVGAGRLAAHRGATRWSAMLVLPVMLGWMFRWGLVANMVGFAVWLFALPSLDRLAKEPTAARALGAAGLTFVLYFGHESQMVLYAVASVVFAVQTPRRWGKLALVACPGLAATALAVIYAIRSESLKAPSIRSVSSVSMPLADKLTSIPGALFSVEKASLPFLVATVLAVVGLAVPTARPRLRRGVVDTRDRALRDKAPASLLERAGESRFKLLAVAAFGFYLFMPLTLGGATLIHQRFLAPAFAMAVLAWAPEGRHATVPGWAPFVALFPVAMLALILGAFVEQDRSYRDLDAVLAKMQDGSAVAQLDLTPRGPSVVAPVVGAAARAVAVHGGRLLFSFTDAPQAPVSIQRNAEWNEPVLRMVNAPFAFMPAHDLKRFRYALVWLTEERVEAAIVSAFAPEGRLVMKQGPWLLFESLLPLVPLTATDRALPSPPPETLGERARRFLAGQ